MYLAYSLTKIIDISDSRAVVRKVKRPYTMFSFRVVCVIIHKMAYMKATAMHFFGHNLLILVHMQL